jgi:hypothetical protein
MTTATEIAPEDRVRFSHLNWLRLRTIDMSAARDMNRVWETLQEMKAVIPTVRAAAARVLDAAFFPVEWTGAGRVSTAMLSPQEWVDVETRELFGEMDGTAARERARSLINLTDLIKLQIDIGERDCCRQWYAGGRDRFSRLSPDAPALQLAVAGAVALSICLQLPASEPDDGRVTFEAPAGKHLAASFKYVTEADEQVMLASTVEEHFAAINAVHAVFIRGLNRH